MISLESVYVSVLFMAYSSGASAFAAPVQTQAQYPDWNVYCMLAQTGRPPQKNVTVKYGEKQDIFDDGKYIFRIEYGDIGNKMILSATNKTTGMLSYAMASADPLPSELTLVIEGATGIFTCFEK